MISEEVVEEANHGVSSLASIRRLINEVVHLSWNSLTADPEDCTLPGSFKVHRARLEWVVGVVNLLGKVKRVVHTDRPTTRWDSRTNWRRGEHIIGGVVLLHSISTVLDDLPEVGSLAHCPEKKTER